MQPPTPTVPRRTLPALPRSQQLQQWAVGARCVRMLFPAVRTRHYWPGGRRLLGPLICLLSQYGRRQGRLFDLVRRGLALWGAPARREA